MIPLRCREWGACRGRGFSGEPEVVVFRICNQLGLITLEPTALLAYTIRMPGSDRQPRFVAGIQVPCPRMSVMDLADRAADLRGVTAIVR